MSNNSVYLDANVLIEIILERGHQAAAKAVLEGARHDLRISALTAHLVVHFGVTRVDLPIIRKFLGDYQILPLEQADFEWAFVNARNQDFEDALQLAVAIRNGCDRFITFDQTLYRAYKQLPSIKLELIGE
jgi:predicted nucleic acid-binding protein